MRERVGRIEREGEGGKDKGRERVGRIKGGRGWEG